MNENNKQNDKRERIINAALEEFSINGYKKTAIDEIVAKAEVSKGLIFHYFGNKKKLYLSLYQYCYDMMATYFFDKLDTTNTDFFHRIKNAEQIKLELLQQYPFFFQFLMKAYFETHTDVKADIDRINNSISPEAIAKSYSNIDYSKLKDNISPDILMKIINWTSYGYMQEVFQRGETDMQKIMDDYNVILDILMANFYKEEYLS
ncbi:TetR/AcrR family transcriptional regulator [Paludicola sp. MB14-C6]|uniref:TetR/AcrR family transcriptional regulator n=1 Tax=Paludihabitans sp. MB14-C6 TaxID=3070656 RepID=UPI0027DCC5AF|nr:TetR/AcrR family transcriptional regulator [Paludicola sp. MB14-C6]WMJ23977.1 TetR/AcrR family transcriptional regulator [Paludicola sp. MB14-C6]